MKSMIHRLVSDLTEQELNVSRDVLLVRDLWAVDLNQKKLLNGVYKQALQIAQEEYITETSRILEEVSQLLSCVERDMMLPLEWDDTVDIIPLLKAYGVRMETPTEPFDRLLDYVRLSHEVLHVRVLVLVGARGFLTTEEYCTLCRELAANELPVLFIDNCCGSAYEGERRLVIDPDHCELLFP